MRRASTGTRIERIGTMRARPSSVRSTWRRLALWPRLAIAVTAGFVGLYVVFGLLALRAVDESTDRILDERLVMAQMAARSVDATLEHGFTELERAKAHAAFDPGSPSHRTEHAVLAHAFGRAASFALGVYFVDRSGRVVLAEPPTGQAPGARLRADRAVRRALRTRKRTISAPFRDPVTRRAVVALTTPVANDDGTVRSALVGLVDVAGVELGRALDQARDLGRTGHAELVSGEGVVVASTDQSEVLRPGEHLPYFLRMLRDRASGVETVAYDPGELVPPERRHERHVMAFVPLKTAPWGVAVGGLDEETFAPASRLQRALLLAGALSLGLLWLLTLLGARFLVRPVRTLTVASQEMASGDLERPVRVVEGGEVGALAESLDRMRLQLRASRSELEAKVSERTAALATRNRQLAAVAAVATAANQARDLDETLGRCLEVVLQDAGMEVGAVRLVENGMLGEPVFRGDPARLACSRGPVAVGTCLCGRAAATGEPVYADARTDSRLAACCRLEDENVVVLLPLRTRVETLGVLVLARAGEELPHDEEQLTLAAVANQLAVAVENARLVEELRHAEAQREMGRLRAELVSAVSHELRTPLGFITSYATTLLRSDAHVDDATRREFLEVIDQETRKLGRMIEELLDASRLQAGRLPVERVEVDVAELVERAAVKARAAVAAAGHTGALSTSLPASDVVVAADPMRTEQVLLNLLDNAARYSNPAAPIDVTVRSEDGHAVISVSDRGDGIAEAEQLAVFEAFHRGEGPRRRGVAGVGLGLAICRGIVEAQGGSIWVESALGEGSTFTFTLPLADRRVEA